MNLDAINSLKLVPPEFKDLLGISYTKYNY